MQEQTTDANPSPTEPGKAEPTSSQGGTAEATPSNGVADPETQVARAASDSLETAATCLVKHDASGNPDTPAQATDSNPSPAEFGATEQAPSHEDMGEAAASSHAAGAEGRVAGAASDCLGATAPIPVGHDAIGNSDLPEQATDANPSPADPGTSEPTSPQEGTSGANDRKDEAGAKDQVSAVPSKAPESILPQTAEGSVKQPAELDEIGWFDPPFIPPAPVRPAPKPAPKPKPRSFMRVIGGAVFGEDYVPTPSDTAAAETEIPAPAAVEDTDDAETAEPSETLSAPVEAPLPQPRIATAADLITWIKRVLLARTILPEDAATLVAFWVISTHFQDASSVLPCLLVTGPARDAMVVLHVLSEFCREAKLLSGFRRADLSALQCVCKTNLVSEPNLDKRTAALLGDLTDRNFMVVDRGWLTCYSKSTAIYAGENPETPRIENSIHVHITQTNSAPPAPPQWLEKMMAGLPSHLDQYRGKNLNEVRRCRWDPSGLSSETAAIAAPLGRCATNAPELRQKLVALLQTRDQQRQSEQSNTIEAIVLEATRTLCRDGQEHAYAREIEAGANRLQEARGEAVRLRPENVGHVLKGLGLPTRRLSQKGNGLIFDKATVARIRELAAMYGVEDTSTETENPHSQQTSENQQIEEVMEVMEVF